MIILGNRTQVNNHRLVVKSLFAQSERIIIATPYLMGDLTYFLDEVVSDKLEHLHLITTITPGSFEQIRKVGSLISLIEFPLFSSDSTKYKISLDNKLHGKVYIFKNSSGYIAAIISSANFTENGLVRNHEWGVQINDQELIQSLERELLNDVEIDDVSARELYKMQQLANDFLTANPLQEIRSINLVLAQNVAQVPTFPSDVSFWLKPVGASNSPIREDRIFGDLETELNFSKKRPNGVKPGDILIAYGVGAKRILSIYEATSYPIEATEDEKQEEEWLQRWPWYIVGRNLTQNFGANWAIHNLYLSELKDNFLSAYPAKPITAAGGQTLGSLNYGSDKLKLSPEFAEYIINIVYGQ